MNLKKILSGFLAAAMAVTTMVTATFSASAADEPHVSVTWTADGDTYTGVAQARPADAADDDWGGNGTTGLVPLAAFIGDYSPADVRSITVTFVVDGNANGLIGLNALEETPTSAWGEWTSVSWGDKNPLTVTLNIPYGSWSSDLQLQLGWINYGTTVTATIDSVTTDPNVVLPEAPELPENEYVFDTASGTAAAGTWGQPANALVGTGKKITSEVLEGDFVVVAPYKSDSRPQLILSDGSGDPNPLNWVKVSPSVVKSGIAYYTKADAVAAWKAAGGSDSLASIVQIHIACADEKALTVTGAKLYSSVAAATEYDITVADDIEHGTVAVKGDKTKAAAGEKVELTVTPDAGYELDEIIVATSTAGTDTIDVAADNTFTMPASNVTVTATFKAPLTGITLDRETASVLVGKKITLNASKVPEGTADETPITWSSGDEAIATVNAATGEVTGKAAGQVIIFAECGSFSKNCVVTVTAEAKPCTGVTLDKTTAEVLKGKTVTLKATTLPSDTTDDITWITSDAAVATVANGVVTGVSRGVATITVKCGDQTAECKVSVNEEETVVIPADPTKPAKAFKSESKDGKYNENDVFVLSADDVKTAKSVTVTVTDNTGKKFTQDVTDCYKTVTHHKVENDGTETTDTISAGANYLLAVTVTGIPDGTTVTVSIAVNK